MLHAPSIAGEGGEPSPIRLRAIFVSDASMLIAIAFPAAPRNAISLTSNRFRRPTVRLDQ